jgi:hypothetical protein
LLFLSAVNEDCGSPDRSSHVCGGSAGTSPSHSIEETRSSKLRRSHRITTDKTLFPIGRANLPTRSVNETRGI